MGKPHAPYTHRWGHLRMFANTQDGVFGVDQEGRVVLWNRAATKILGFSQEETLGRHCCDVMRGLDVSGNLLCYPGCQVMVLSADEQPIHHFHMRTRRKDGQEIWIEISTIIVSADVNRPGGTVHLFRHLPTDRRLSGGNRKVAHSPTDRLNPQTARPSAPVEGAGTGAARSLTAREREILRLLANGLRSAAIAEKLCISHTTVRNHIQHILAKLGAHSRLEAVSVVFGQQLISSTFR